MALFSFRHSVRTFSEKRTAEARAAKHGQTAAHLRYITRPQAARTVLRERLSEPTDARVAQAAEREAATRKGRVCERFIIALPVEATPEQREALVRSFCEALTKGVAGYVAAIHDKSGNDITNPHAHIAAFDVQVKTGGRGRPRSTIGMARKNAVEETAALWADLHNRLMDGWGYGPESHITHLSYAARGIDRIAQIHEGAANRAMVERGKEGATKPEWHHIDEGYSRAEANAIIREINEIRETENEQADWQADEHTEYRLGNHDEERGRERESCCEDDGARGRGAGRDPGYPEPPFASVEQLGEDGRGSQDEAGTDDSPAPPFLHTAAASALPTPLPPFITGWGLYRRSGLRRVFRELVMLRDTLRARLLRSRQAALSEASITNPARPRNRQAPTARQLERE